MFVQTGLGVVQQAGFLGCQVMQGGGLLAGFLLGQHLLGQGRKVLRGGVAHTLRGVFHFLQALHGITFAPVCGIGLQLLHQPFKCLVPGGGKTGQVGNSGMAAQGRIGQCLHFAGNGVLEFLQALFQRFLRLLVVCAIVFHSGQFLRYIRLRSPDIYGGLGTGVIARAPVLYI